MASSCAGQVVRKPTEQLRALLHAGVFDQAMQQALGKAPEEAACLVASLGWKAVSERGRGVLVQLDDHARDMAPD
jgi:hypothetical protein